MEKVFNNAIVKALILTIIPGILTLIDNLTGEWTGDEQTFIDIIIQKKYLFIVGLIYLVIVAWYQIIEYKKVKDDKKYLALIDKLNKSVAAYEEEIKSLTTIFDISQSNISKITEYLKSTNRLDLREWNINMMATHICSGVYNTISEVAESGKDFTVNIYIKKTILKKKYIRMIAHEGQYKKTVGILNVNKLMDTNMEYCNVRQFEQKNPVETILMNWKAIKKAFKFNGESEKYRNEYNQYIGIPICSSGNNVIALLEIIAHEDSIIAKENKGMKEIINKYLLCYHYFILLSLIIERNMIRNARILENMEVGEYE